jgi:hypothetical protein
MDTAGLRMEIFTLSSGEAIHIGDAITLTVLAVDGDYIRLGLEAMEGVSSQATAGTASKPTSSIGGTGGNNPVSPFV